MTGSIAVSQCGHTPNRPGHHGTVVARTVGTVAISCNGSHMVDRLLLRTSCKTVLSGSKLDLG